MSARLRHKSVRFYAMSVLHSPHPNRDITRCSSIGRVFALGAKEYRFNSNHLDVHDITCDDREDT